MGTHPFLEVVRRPCESVPEFGSSPLTLRWRILFELGCWKRINPLVGERSCSLGGESSDLPHTEAPRAFLQMMLALSCRCMHASWMAHGSSVTASWWLLTLRCRELGFGFMCAIARLLEEAFLNTFDLTYRISGQATWASRRFASRNVSFHSSRSDIW